MSEPGTTSYLDAIFGGLRAAGNALKVSQQWLDRAAKTKDMAWRAVFLGEARSRWVSAAKALADVEGRLGTSGIIRASDGLTPIEQLQSNVAAMRKSIDEHEQKVASALLELAGGGQRGSA